ncbi:hypothetical protein GXW83_04955 [Streptacidiphilus sp. PB12-B1b]|uniref:hypothetical protein n=1 Tax=Streptacidiphilus sp. PB12-B1b TaxID=2705012 RepID=UPI0015FB990B|nr:hypothetical protein [Streptacidiphilus sp. PB12-B1b]QMU75202.1 hypothetical protein GXW83_04955 [Streptacidiphilus sp. PB12-B1b]
MTEVSAERLDRALVEESAKKSGLVWVGAGAGRPGGDRPVWHIWHDGAVVLVGDGAEQPLHGWAAGDTVTVTVRSKDSWGRLVAWPARVEELAPQTPEWAAAVQELKAKRLNSPDHDTVAERWARESRVLRLVPAGGTSQRPGALPDDAHTAVPVQTPATTRKPVPAALPKLLFGRGRRRRGGQPGGS